MFIYLYTRIIFCTSHPDPDLLTYRDICWTKIYFYRVAGAQFSYLHVYSIEVLILYSDLVFLVLMHVLY